MTIPKTFQLHGITHHVRYDPKLVRDHDATGEARYGAAEVRLVAPENNWYKRDQLEHVFCHELVHFILYHMSSKLRNDEAFVNNFAFLLHQALSTQKGVLK